jgi:putative DNA primase/helicase
MSIAQSNKGASDRIAKEVAAMAAAGLPAVLVWGAVSPGVCRCPKGANCPSPGKHPVDRDWGNTATTDEDTIFDLWADGTNNVGILLGPKSGIIDVEYDTPEGAETIERLGLDLAPTPTYESSRSVHRLFRWNQSLPDEQTVKPAGLEVRMGGKGKQTQSVAPPSTHHTGKAYCWRPGFGLADVDIAEIPPTLLDLILGKSSASESPADIDTPAAPGEPRGWDILTSGPFNEGCRNSAIVSLAGAVANSPMKAAQASAILHDANNRLCRPPLPQREVNAIAKQARKWAQDATAARDYAIEGTPGPANLSIPATWNQISLARRVAIAARGTLRFVAGDGYYLFDGTRWLRDVDGSRAQSIAKNVADELVAGVASLPLDEQKAAMAFAKDASRKNTINAAIELARSEPDIALDASALNADPFLLNLPNGTVELTTGTFREHRPGDFITECAAAEYDASADCPRFKTFVEEITSGDAELPGFLQRSFGYALSGDVTDHALWLHVGDGGAGKSTLLNVVSEVLGTYAGTATQNFLLQHKHSGDDAKRYALLRGKRFVVIPEQGDAAAAGRLNTSAIKMLTGGDRLAVWELYRGHSVLKPTWKLHAVCNMSPRTSDVSDALFRRLKVVRYLKQFLGPRADRGLSARIISDELPGVLRWLLDGFAAWHRDRALGEPPAVNEATNEYRRESDAIGRWLAERCVAKPTLSAPASELFCSYRGWCSAHDEPPESDNALGRALSDRGFKRDRRHGVTLRLGLALRDAALDDEE